MEMDIWQGKVKACGAMIFLALLFSSIAFASDWAGSGYSIDFFSVSSKDNGVGSGYDVNLSLPDFPVGNGVGSGYDVNLGPLEHIMPRVSKLAQSFRLFSDANVSSVQLRVKRNSLPDNFVVSVESDSSGKPSGVPLASRLTATTSFTGTYEWYTFSFDVPVHFSKDTNYWIVATIQEGSVYAENYQLDGALGYAEGLAKFFDNFNWIQDGLMDYSFKLGNYGATILTTNFVPVLNVRKVVLVALEAENSNNLYYVSRNGGQTWDDVPMTLIGNERTGINSFVGALQYLSTSNESLFSIRVLMDDNSTLEALGAKWRWND